MTRFSPGKNSPFEKLTLIVKFAHTIKQKYGVGLLRQYIEIVLLFLIKRLGPMYYFEAGLWRKDLSFNGKLSFLNQSQYNARLDHLNPPNYRKLSQHKLAEKALLTQLKIPTPKVLGYLHQSEGSYDLYQPLTNAPELVIFLSEFVGKIICFKPCEGWGGNGFLAVRITRHSDGISVNVLGPHRMIYSPQQFFVKCLSRHIHQGYVVEEYLQQHRVVRQLNPTSVNTLRFWLRKRDSNVEVIGALLRIGREGQLVDNSSQGGVLSVIDCATGILGPIKSAEVMPTLAVNHPDTDIPVEGVQLPFWGECIRLAKETLRVFPNAAFVGLDMAISENGPVIIELNLEPDRISARNFKQSLKEILS